jgi:hypothetical protein
MLLATALAGCTEEAANPVSSDALAIYGVNAQVSYPGTTSSLAKEAMVYVFLRKPGTNMPVAVRHFSAGELPKSVSFTGAAPEQQFELVVRLSPSGRVDRSPEDIEITQVVPGFGHPPQNYAMVLGASPEATGADTAQADTVGKPPPVAIRAAFGIRVAVGIEASHPFPANTVVFVIARKPGQAMPSVVKRLSLADLPTAIELTDADAMTFANRLSDAARLDLFARVSTSGTAMRSNADWVSETVHLETAKLPELVTLTISPPSAQ